MDGGSDLDGAIPLGGAVVLGELGLGGHLVGGGGELAGVARHLFDGAVDLGDKVVEAGRHLGQFVTAIDLEAMGEVAITAAEFAEQAGQFVEGRLTEPARRTPSSPMPTAMARLTSTMCRRALSSSA